MFRIIKIPPAVDVKVVQSKNRYFFSEGSLIYLVGHHLERRGGGVVISAGIIAAQI